VAEADLIRAIGAKYRAMPKAERVETLAGLCEADPKGFPKFLRKFFPRFWKEIRAEEDAKRRRPKRRATRAR
jgi:hypothetical protein